MKKILALALGMALMTSVAYAEKVKLSILAMVEPGTVGEEAFNQTVEQFQAAFPDIELELERVSHDPFHSKLQAMAVGKQLPDAFFLWPGKRTGYVTAAGLAKDLRPWLKGKEDQFLTGMLAPQGPNGEIFELPNAQGIRLDVPENAGGIGGTEQKNQRGRFRSFGDGQQRRLADAVMLFEHVNRPRRRAGMV